MTVLIQETRWMVKYFTFDFVGMYANDDDGYGDEVDGDDDRNDGMNALVSYLSW